MTDTEHALDHDRLLEAAVELDLTIDGLTDREIAIVIMQVHGVDTGEPNAPIRSDTRTISALPIEELSRRALFVHLRGLP